MSLTVLLYVYNINTDLTFCKSLVRKAALPLEITDTLTSKYLNGVRVLDFTRAFSGPLCTMMLAEMGADVIKIENPTDPDETRTWPPHIDGVFSTYFAALNRGKRSIAIDLKADEGLQVVKRLVATADVVIENFTPGVAEKLGIDYASLAHEHEGLVYCSISGFGQTGPYRQRKGYDPVLQAMGGFMGVTGEANGEPVKSMIPVADYTTGLFSAIGILAAIYRSRATGQGEYIDLAMLDVMVALTSTIGSAYLHTGLVPPRSGTRNPARVPSAAFVCSDGISVQLVPNQKQWARFCAAIDAPELIDDERFADNLARVKNQEKLYPLLTAIFLKRSSSEWLTRLLDAGIAAGPIHTLDTLFSDPQVVARDLVHEYDHPVVGSFKGIRLPGRSAHEEPGTVRHPPAAGENTIEVLSSAIGLSADTITRLLDDGVCADPAKDRAGRDS